jgi:hypothetical protein
MSHPQALHTSCRSGLSSQQGFQFNAASRSLDRAVLAQLASGHAGYHVPRDMPLEPTAAELERFPVALKVTRVDGLGTVVSRTTYVGREFRGRDGQPDEGRFGNYFSHIVVGGAGDDAFDGLLGIELWDAPHWTELESSQPVLPELGSLQPGSLDVDRVMSMLSGIPRGLMATVLDAAVAALDGGPRLVIVEPDSGRAAAWIGWISYGLPAEQARRLTFTTFDGRPRYADDVQVCVTTPACDIAFAQHEVGRSVRLVDVTAGARGDHASLYARAAIALARDGTDALATAVRRIPGSAAGARRGAWLAVAGTQTDLVEHDELAAVVDLLRELAGQGQVSLAAATAKELPADASVDHAALGEWAALHRAARALPADSDSRSLAETALARIVPFAGELPEELPAIPQGTPTQPSVGNLAPWLSRVENAATTAACAPLVRDGLRLGLIGVNAAVDRRLARALSDGLADSSVQSVLRAIGERPALEHIVVAVTEAAAERAAGDGGARLLTRELGLHPATRATLQRRAVEQPSFERLALWLRYEVEADPSRRRSAAQELAAHARSDRDHADIRELWGADGPRTADEHVELLDAYLQGAGQPPYADALCALDALMRQPFTGAQVTDALGATLNRCDKRVRHHPSFVAWWVAVTTPGAVHPFARWAQAAAAALAADEREVPADRWDELRQVICRAIVDERRAPDYATGIATLRGRTRRHVDDGLVFILEEGFRAGSSDRNTYLAAALFQAWRAVPGDGEALVGDVLVRACGAIKRRDLEDVQEHLPPVLQQEWQLWVERLPRSTVARAFTRRGRRSKDADVQG